ncbi:heme peroxidase [Auricularia subglabra TFB-10046 SS5]|uniref:Peroxidase n=1 Tax=Auricularia subglabra (strain TFB-10046 / SS5) TaxID=717982 RepID=J0WW42_AURST|nr:heme peroxidase [Auricularia subglabra TFB-10046 SS5]
MTFFKLQALSLISSAAARYAWPDPKYEAIEQLRWDQRGYGSTALFTPCDTFIGGTQTGRSNSADWVRAAYHDAATYNAEDGTGGLDASIRFEEEQQRAENVGTGFANTFFFVNLIANRYVTYADGLAAAATIMIENCGGPVIDYRGGRVDATEPNKPGVPEPQQSLEEHVASFKKQGFNKTEMIGLVACGHSFGGVQHSSFPDLVPELNDPANTESNARFDTTFRVFDNAVATEYIKGTTQNPLVVGSNDTLNSDKRIFGSDGNATMAALAADPEHFARTCATLIAKMLDTVPRGVRLTDVITPIPVKPYDVQISYNANGTLNFIGGNVRLWNVAENPNRVVRGVVTDKNGVALKPVVLSHSSFQIGTAAGERFTSTWYTWPTLPAMDAAASIAKFHYEIDEGDGTPVRVADQDGLGFPMRDDVLFSETSCNYDSTGFPRPWRFDVAVRKGLNASRIFLQTYSLPTLTLEPMLREVGSGSYDLWSADVLPENDGIWTVSYQIEGMTIDVPGKHRIMLIDCPA